MKRGTPRHPKMYALSDALTIPLPYAVGLMEMLWQHAAQYTPQGDIGSLPDTAIAQGCGFSRKPQVLIDALVSCGWLDRDPTYRLVVHDWPDHCEQSVKKYLDYWDKKFLPIYGVSPEKLQQFSGESPPSREAMAMAEANGNGGFKKIKSETSLLTETQSGWFSQFWAAYWRRIGKGEAEKSFARLVRTQERFDIVMQALALQSPWMMQKDSDKRPHPATWLNQKRWEDDPDVQQALDPRSRNDLAQHNLLVAGLERRGL